MYNYISIYILNVQTKLEINFKHLISCDISQISKYTSQDKFQQKQYLLCLLLLCFAPREGKLLNSSHQLRSTLDFRQNPNFQILTTARNSFGKFEVHLKVQRSLFSDKVEFYSCKRSNRSPFEYG